MRALVTGSTGFVGSNLVRRLLAEGAEVHAIVRADSDTWRLQGVLDSIVPHVADLRAGTAILAAVAAARPDAVFHLAAYGASPAHVDVATMVATNVAGTSALLEAVRETGCASFVHLGGSSEYGPHDHPLRETDLPEPSTPYGATKAAATTLALQAARGGGLPVTVLRAFSVYGPWEPRTRLVPTTIVAALEDRTLALTAPGFYRDFVFVDDVVEACMLALGKHAAIGQVFNIGTGVMHANEDVVAEVERLTGREIRTEVGAYPPRRSDTTHWVADTSKATEILGWRARHGLSAGLSSTIDWFRENAQVRDAYA